MLVIVFRSRAQTRVLGPNICAGKHSACVCVIYRLFGDGSCFQIKSTWLLSEPSPPTPSPADFTSLILSLIFLTWVMAFVIPNDSRNKSTVMRSHWVLFFFPFLWNHPSQLRTINLFVRTEVLDPSSSGPVWNRSIPSSGRPPCSQNGHPVLLSMSVFSNIQDLLSLDSLELISWPHVHAARCVSKLCLMTPLAYLLIYLGFLVCLFAYFLAVSSMIMHWSITEEVCVHVCMLAWALTFS